LTDANVKAGFTQVSDGPVTGNGVDLSGDIHHANTFIIWIGD
jgi:hypothetical protein